MAPIQKNSIEHFTHPSHPLKPLESDKQFLCDGCKTPGGTGKKYRCNPCDFDLHEYCATCPLILSSFMHAKHVLTLVTRKAQSVRQVERICDVCKDPVEGLFYRCKDCEFDVHPVCTQLPQKLQHALHKIHPLDLQSSSKLGFCGVCRGLCENWRYRCGICNFDIHLECVLVPIVPCTAHAQPSTQRGIPIYDQGVPFQAPPQFVPYSYYYGHPNYGPGYPFGPGYNMYHGPNMYPMAHNFMPHNQHVSVSSNGTGGTTGRLGKSMFSLVGQLGFGVLSNMIFGLDLS